MEYFKLSIESLSPNNPNPHELFRNNLNLGIVQRKLGLVKDSIVSLKIAAMALSPGKPVAWNSLGLSHMEVNEPEAALSAFNTAIQLEEQNTVDLKSESSARS